MKDIKDSSAVPVSAESKEERLEAELASLEREYRELLEDFRRLDGEYQVILKGVREAHWKRKAQKSWRTAGIFARLTSFFLGVALGQYIASLFGYGQIAMENFNDIEELKKSIEKKRAAIEDLRAERSALIADMARLEKRSEDDKKDMRRAREKAATRIPAHLMCGILLIAGTVIGTIIFAIF